MPDLDTALFGIFAIIIAWQLFRGYRRGICWQVLHIILSCGSAYVSYRLVSFISEKLLSGSTMEAVEKLLGVVEGIGPLKALGLNLSGAVSYFEYAEMILALPVAVVLSPILFTVAYFLINLVMQVPFYVLRIFLPRGFTPKTKGLGALAGILEGFLISAIILVPFVAANNLVTDARVIADESYVAEENTIIEIADELGLGKIVDKFATVTIDGEETNLSSDTSKLIAVVLKYQQIKPIDKTSPDEEDKEFLRYFIDTVGESSYLSTMVSSVLSGAGNAMKDNVLVVNIPAPYNMLTNAGLEVFATSNKDNLHSDMHTLLDVYLLLSDEGIVESLRTQGSESVMRDAFLVRDENGKTLIDRITTILNANDHTKIMLNAITEMSIAMLSESLGLDVNIAEKYEELKTGINGVLALDPSNYTPEEYVAARNDALNSTLASNGIELDDAIINDMGDYIDEHYSDVDELTEEQFNDIILSYYEIYENNLPEGILP